MFQALAAEVSTVTVAIPPLSVLTLTHGSGLAWPLFGEQSGTGTPLRKMTTSLAVRIPGLPETSSESVIASGFAAVAAGALIVSAWPEERVAARRRRARRRRR